MLRTLRDDLGIDAQALCRRKWARRLPPPQPVECEHGCELRPLPADRPEHFMYRCPMLPACSDCLGPYDRSLLDRFEANRDFLFPEVARHNGLADVDESYPGFETLGRVTWRAPEPVVVWTNSPLSLERVRREGAQRVFRAPAVVLHPRRDRVEPLERLGGDGALLSDAMDDFGILPLHLALDAMEPGYRARRVSQAKEDIDSIFDDLVFEIGEDAGRRFCRINGRDVPNVCGSDKRFGQLMQLAQALRSGEDGWVHVLDLGIDENYRGLSKLRASLAGTAVPGYDGEDLKALLVIDRGAGMVRLQLRRPLLRAIPLWEPHGPSSRF